MIEDDLPEHINDLWEDMDRLNALYEELMWEHDVELEFKADYENNRIIIKPYECPWSTTCSSQKTERVVS